MPEERDYVVKLVDDHGVGHSLKVSPESVYDAALKGWQRLDRVGWESGGTRIGWVVVPHASILVLEMEQRNT